jgi:hypothetical protein
LKMVPNDSICALFLIPSWLGTSDWGRMLILIGIFGLLLCGFSNDYIVMLGLLMKTMNRYPSRGITSLFCVGHTWRARIDVFSNDIESLLFVIVCTNSYSRRLVRESNIYNLK